MHFIGRFLSIAVLGLTAPAIAGNEAAVPIDEAVTPGRLLYFDVNLSKNRTQSCATCHAPERGFVDSRPNAAAGAVSLGDDGRSLGDRNAPTVSYAGFSPRFHRSDKGEYVGGQFLDGREPDLKGQAGGPPLNPIEMGMPEEAAVVARLRENPVYVAALRHLYGDRVFEDTETAYAAMAESIAAFEKTDFFAPFDSRYDRHLRGQYRMTPQEELSMTLFFSSQFTNCNLCHQLKRLPASEGETFSNYEYHNIGTPVNTLVRALNGLADGHVDRGLLDNPDVNDPAQAGKFKVPTLPLRAKESEARARSPR